MQKRVMILGANNFMMPLIKKAKEEGYYTIVASPVKEFALEKGLTVYQPEKVRKNEEFIEKIKSNLYDGYLLGSASCDALEIKNIIKIIK